MFLGEGGSFLNSPRFQAQDDLNKSQFSCLPESRSPVKPFQPTPIERRLMLKAQVSERKLADLRQQRDQAAAAAYRDRPQISDKSKQLARQAELRFWQKHSNLSLKERIKAVLQPGKAQPVAAQPRQRHLRTRSDATQRSITPVPVHVSYPSGCNFSRFLPK